MNRVIAKCPLKEIAIIGFWRSGATYAEISEATGIEDEIDRIIVDYSRKNNVHLHVTEDYRLIWK